MDPTVPKSAALLLDFIGEIETGTNGRASYDVIYAHKQGKLSKPLASMTLDEVVAAQVAWSKNHGSSAAGRYQFMRATLRGLMSELGLRGSQQLAPNLQDRLGFHLLKRRGYDAFIYGQIDAAEFGKRLAMEWASLPVLEGTQGQKRKVMRGQSYYAGDGLNKALVSPERVEAVLAEAFRIARPQPDDPGIDPGTQLSSAPPNLGPIIAIAIFLGALAIAGAFFFGR